MQPTYAWEKVDFCDLCSLYLWYLKVQSMYRLFTVIITSNFDENDYTKYITKLVLSSFNLIIYCSQCRYFFSTPAFSSVLFTSCLSFVFTLFQLKIVVVVFCCIFWVQHECCCAVSLDNNDMAVFFFCFCYIK